AGDVLVIDTHDAAIAGDQAYDHIETGGLARPVGAKQSNDFSRKDLEGDVFYNGTFLVCLGQIICRESLHAAARLLLTGAFWRSTLVFRRFREIHHFDPLLLFLVIRRSGIDDLAYRIVQ